MPTEEPAPTEPAEDSGSAVERTLGDSSVQQPTGEGAGGPTTEQSGDAESGEPSTGEPTSPAEEPEPPAEEPEPPAEEPEPPAEEPEPPAEEPDQDSLLRLRLLELEVEL